MSDIDQRVTDYYQSQTLSGDRMQSLLLQSQRTRRRRYYYPLGAVAAMLLMMVVTTFHRYSLNDQRITVALNEAAMNHATKLQLDVTADSLSGLQSSLEKLPFNLVLPEDGPYESLALLGGRYCTISGNLAAHLRFSDLESGEQYSLFMTPFSPDLKSMTSAPAHIDGVEVALWQEKKVVYAMAKSATVLPQKK